MSQRLLAVLLVSLAPAVASAAPICHKTGNGWLQLDISASAVSAHTKHGDRAPATQYLDADGDGLGDPANALVSCDLLDGYVGNANDLDDGNPSLGACLEVTGDWDTTMDSGSGPQVVGYSALVGTSCSFTGVGISGTGYGWTFTVDAGSFVCAGTVISPSKLEFGCPSMTVVLTR